MKPLLLILLFAFTASAQNWKPIKEMSGEIPNHPGLTIEIYAAQIERGDNVTKLRIRFDFPWGSPGDLLKENVPWGTDPTSISRVEGGFEFNCKTLIVKPDKASADVYQFNGKKFKSKEPPFSLDSGHILFQYFCEQPSASVSTGPPVLKRRP